MKNNDYNFRVILLCCLKNIISLICFTILAVVFKHWWIVFFSLLFYSYTEKENQELKKQLEELQEEYIEFQEKGSDK